MYLLLSFSLSLGVCSDIDDFETLLRNSFDMPSAFRKFQFKWSLQGARWFINIKLLITFFNYLVLYFILGKLSISDEMLFVIYLYLSLYLFKAKVWGKCLK